MQLSLTSFCLHVLALHIGTSGWLCGLWCATRQKALRGLVTTWVNFLSPYTLSFNVHEKKNFYSAKILGFLWFFFKIAIGLCRWIIQNSQSCPHSLSLVASPFFFFSCPVITVSDFLLVLTTLDSWSNFWLLGLIVPLLSSHPFAQERSILEKIDVVYDFINNLSYQRSSH